MTTYVLDYFSPISGSELLQDHVPYPTDLSGSGWSVSGGDAFVTSACVVETGASGVFAVISSSNGDSSVRVKVKLSGCAIGGLSGRVSGNDYISALVDQGQYLFYLQKTESGSTAILASASHNVGINSGSILDLNFSGSMIEAHLGSTSIFAGDTLNQTATKFGILGTNGVGFDNFKITV